MIDFCKVCNLIYEDKTKESCLTALELLAVPAYGIEEAMRLLYMRDAYFQLKQKEKVIEYGRLANEYMEDFFKNKNLLDSENLNDQCIEIKDTLLDNDICDIKIEACVQEEKDTFKIVLENPVYNKGLLTSNLKQEIDVKIGTRRREERYLYYKAVAKELLRKIEEIVPRKLYGKVQININRIV